MADAEKASEIGLVRGEAGQRRLLLSLAGVDRLEKLFAKSCPLGQYRFADPDGVLLDIMAD